MLTVNALQDLLAYSAWSSRRLVEAAAQLPFEELTRDFGTADKSVLGTLVHIFAADRLWFARVGFIAKFWEEATQAGTSRLSVNLVRQRVRTARR